MTPVAPLPLPLSAQGDLITAGVDLNPARVALGSASYILTSNGESFSWQPAPYIDVRSFFAAGDGVTDDTESIQEALDFAASVSGICFASGTFKTTATLTAECDFDFSGATLNVDGDLATIGFQAGVTGSVTRYKNAKFPRIINTGKPTTGWDSGSIGIKVLNAYGWMIVVPYVFGWETGIWMTADSAIGTEHCHVWLGTILDNKIGIRLAPEETVLYSYVNENKLWGGNFGHSTAERSAGPTWYQTGAYHILMDEVASTVVAVRTATGGSSSTLVDAGATGTANQYANRRIRITGGTGSGQSRIISSHGAGVGITFTMSSNWETAPDATSTYVIESYARTNSNKFYGPSLQGDVCEYHLDFSSSHQCSLYDGRYETHQPAVVFPKVRFAGPFTTENRLMFGYDLDAATITETNGAQQNRVATDKWEWMRGGAKGVLTLQNDVSNSTGAIYVVPAGTALSADATSVYTTKIASAEVVFKATGDANDRLEIVPSTGRINFGPGSTATDAGIEWKSADKIGTQAGDSWYVASELEVDGAINHDGSTVGFYGVAPTTRPTALTAANISALNTGDATSDTVIGNMRTRINELETKLQALGLLT